MTKLERFYAWLQKKHGHRAVGLACGVLETPRGDMADFELALNLFTPEDEPILSACLCHGVIDGQWRAEKMYARLDDLRPNRIFDTRWVTQ
jgi:hypothetical protein